MILMEDNIVAMKWGNSDKRTKHVDIQYRFLRDMVARGALDLEYCPIDLMFAGLTIKPLLSSRFKELRAKILPATGGGLGRAGYVGGPSGHEEEN